MYVLLSAVFAMSLTGSGLWLLLRLARPLTGRLCSARWEKATRAAVLCAYLFPAGLLLRPLLAPAPVLTVPAPFSSYGAVVSLPPIWALTGQDRKPGPPLLWPAILAAVWLTGALTAAALLFIRQRRFLHSLRRTALPVEEEGLLVLLERQCKELRISPVPALFTSERVRTPLGAGLFRPALYLPELLFTPQELELILRHELLHIKRRDLWFKWTALAALSLHWFNPVAWAFVRECGLLCETACDEAATRGLDQAERRRYGSAILDTLYRAAPPERGVCSSFCDRPSGLELRLKRLLHPRRGWLGQVCCTLLVFSLLLGALPFSSSVHAWAEPYHGWARSGDYQANLARTALEYLPFGVTYDAGADLFFYRGEALSAFIDTLEPTAEQLAQFPEFNAIWNCGWSGGRGVSGPAYRTVRDGERKIVGLALLTDAEKDGFLENSADSVCFNGYCLAPGEDSDVYATDPAWDSLPRPVRDWALSIPNGSTAAMADAGGGYLCYGGLHCPWQLKRPDSGLEVYFYPGVQGSDPSRPCVIRYNTQKPPEKVLFYVN